MNSDSKSGPALPQEVIRRKRDGERLREDELEGFFSGFMAGGVADYQMASFLMSVFFRGMETEEVAALTRIMQRSGDTLRWEGGSTDVVDKHSTGGVGDKTSLILLPMCALEGVRVPMISGRGLGHTGGTVDKLEAVEGMTVALDTDRAHSVLKKFGGVFLGQTAQLCPMDRRLYAMRDVTATIESIPLITGSILSKKLAAGIGSLCMDIKTGSGAFMACMDQAEALARSLLQVGRACGLKMTCFVTDMDSPLGETAGNLLEVFECMDIMQGKGPASTRDLCLELAVQMVRMGQPRRQATEILKSVTANLESGRVWEHFVAICEAQGASNDAFKNRDAKLKTRLRVEVKSPTKGWVSKINTRTLGIAVQILGGGRRLMTDTIDPVVGLSGLKRVGDSSEKAEPLAIVHGNDESSVKEAVRLVTAAYSVSEAQVKALPLVLSRMGDES